MEEKRSGEFVGAFAPYGYIKSTEDNHKLVIDKESAEIVKKIFEWKVNDGLGNLSICHMLNDMGILNPTGYKKKKLNQNYNNSQMTEEDYSWSPSTIRNILRNDIYIGNITQGKRRVKSYKIHKLEQVPEGEWITVENMHEPIIDTKLFEKAQQMRNVDTRVQNSGELSIWSGLLKCADCGRAMHKKYCKNKSGKIYEYYVCGTYRKKSNKLCTKHTIKVEELENAILEIIKMHIDKFVNIDESLEKIDRLDIKKLQNQNIEKMKIEKEKEIERINKIKRNLYEDWKNDYITKEEYLEYKRKYENDINIMTKSIENIEKQKENEKQTENKNYKWIEEFKKNRNITKLDRDIVNEMIDHIEIHENKEITIYFKFVNK